MSKDVDFVSSNFENFKKIVRPSSSLNSKSLSSSQLKSNNLKDKDDSKTFTI
jgi:hypothetical protein